MDCNAPLNNWPSSFNVLRQRLSKSTLDNDGDEHKAKLKTCPCTLSQCEDSLVDQLTINEYHPGHGLFYFIYNSLYMTYVTAPLLI